MKYSPLASVMLLAAFITLCGMEKKNDSVAADAPVEQVESLVPPSDSLASELFWKSSFCNDDTACVGKNADCFTAKARSMMKEFLKVDEYRYHDDYREFYSHPFKRYNGKPQVDYIAVSMRADTAWVEIQLTVMYYSEEKKPVAVLSLLREDGQWRIDDFGENGLSFQRRTREILKERRTIFRKLGIKDDDRHHGVDAYFELYPDSVTWADAPDEPFVIDASPELARQIVASGLTEQRCKDLYMAIPGGCNLNRVRPVSFPLNFTPELAARLQEAFEIPCGEVDGIGYADGLFDFNGTGWGCSVEKVNTVHIHPESEDSATVNVSVIYWAEEHRFLNFTMQVVWQDGRWLISSMQTDSIVNDYISFLRQYLRSEKWEKEVADYRQYIEREKDSVKQDSMRTVLQKAINEVDEYFRKYPD